MGLKTLGIIHQCIKNVKRIRNLDIEENGIPLEDDLAYQLLRKGRTAGVFQVESDGLSGILMKMKKLTFLDVIAIIALYRPGSLDYIPNFIARANGDEEIEYICPELEPILKETYGITIYQEQCMRISTDVSGFTKAESSNFRKIIGKKQREKIQEQLDWIVYGCHENGHDIDGAIKKVGMTEEQALGLAETLRNMGKYSFNKSHAAAYAVLTVRTAYLKAHFLPEYMAALISSCMFSSDNSEDAQSNTVMRYVEEAKADGIEFLPADINKSDYHFIPEQNGKNIAIRIGFGTVNGVGKNGIHIWKERTEHGLFKDLYDLCNRLPKSVLNKKVLLGLVYSGTLDGLAYQTKIQDEFLSNKLFGSGIINRHVLLEIIFNIMEREDFGEELLDGLKKPEITYKHLHSLYSKYIKDDTLILKIQEYYLKKYFTGFCIDTFPIFNENSLKISQRPLNESFTDLCVVCGWDKVVSKRGNTVYLVRVEFAKEKYTMLCFESLFEDNKNKFSPGNILEVTCNVGMYQGKRSLTFKSAKYFRTEKVTVVEDTL